MFELPAQTPGRERALLLYPCTPVWATGLALRLGFYLPLDHLANERPTRRA